MHGWVRTQGLFLSFLTQGLYSPHSTTLLSSGCTSRAGLHLAGKGAAASARGAITRCLQMFWCAFAASELCELSSSGEPSAHQRAWCSLTSLSPYNAAPTCFSARSWVFGLGTCPHLPLPLLILNIDFSLHVGVSASHLFDYEAGLQLLPSYNLFIL